MDIGDVNLHNILWTGGWDSTFRILDLVINRKENVQPYYILDNERPSTSREIKTMEIVKNMVSKKDPLLSTLIADTIMINIENIPTDRGITNKYISLKTQSHLGNQYEWLARYAKYNNLYDLELCIHADDKAEKFIKNDVCEVNDINNNYFKMNDNLSNPSLDIFSYFHFPLLSMSKLDMDKIAKQFGFSDIMEHTWFCYTPTRRGTPCGSCNPCRYTRNEGLGRRVPSKFVGFLNGVDRKLSRITMNKIKKR